jgi:AcrR family transcriptional regulator
LYIFFEYRRLKSVVDINMLVAKPEDLRVLPPEERIIVATIECVDEYGLEGTTVRAIASRANLNPASINYYFRSKERLIETALREAWRQVLLDIDRIRSEVADPAEAFGCAAHYLIEGAYRHAKLVRAIIVEHPSIRTEAIHYLRESFSRRDAAKEGGQEADLSSALLLSFTVLLGFGSETVSHVTGIDFDDPESRNRLVEGLIRLLFAPSS